MSAEFFGFLSGGLVAVSIIPYSIRVYQRKILPRLTSWILWWLIGLAILATYKSSGAQENAWPVIFGFFNPGIVAMLIVFRQRGRIEKPDKVEISCLIIGLVSLGMWLVVYGNRELSQYALYLAMVADLCAAVPTIKFVWKYPDSDRPFAWILFAIAYGLAIFSITEPTFANYVLPIYMVVGASSVALPLVLYRVKIRATLNEWV